MKVQAGETHQGSVILGKTKGREGRMGGDVIERGREVGKSHLGAADE